MEHLDGDGRRQPLVAPREPVAEDGAPASLAEDLVHDVLVDVVEPAGGDRVEEDLDRMWPKEAWFNSKCRKNQKLMNCVAFQVQPRHECPWCRRRRPPPQRRPTTSLMPL